MVLLPEDFVLEGTQVSLVPFKDFMINQYYQWMQDEKILEQTNTESFETASDVETVRQQTEGDSKKVTFIILDKDQFKKIVRDDINEATRKERIVESMVGDVCCFLSENTDDNFQGEWRHTSSPRGSIKEGGLEQTSRHPRLVIIGELSVMIPQAPSRRKGFASDAIRSVMSYCDETFAVDKYVAKIKHGNEASHRLFEKLGFITESCSEVFGETTMVRWVQNGAGVGA